MKNFDKFVDNILSMMREAGAVHAIYGIRDSYGEKEFVEYPEDATFYDDDECYEYDVNAYLENGACAVYALHLHY